MFLRLESSISGNIKNLFRVFFHFFSAERALSKNKKKYEARKFHFEKYKKFIDVGVRKFHFLKYNQFFWWGFFFILGSKVAQLPRQLEQSGDYSEWGKEVYCLATAKFSSNVNVMSHFQINIGNLQDFQQLKISLT